MAPHEPPIAAAFGGNVSTLTFIDVVTPLRKFSTEPVNPQLNKTCYGVEHSPFLFLNSLFIESVPTLVLTSVSCYGCYKQSSESVIQAGSRFWEISSLCRVWAPIQIQKGVHLSFFHLFVDNFIRTTLRNVSSVSTKLSTCSKRRSIQREYKIDRQ